MTDVDLTVYPGYRPGSPPQYAEYHAEVDFLDEVEAIWGRSGAPRASADSARSR